MSYKQPVKNAVRENVLKNAIKYLTEERKESPIVTEKYMDTMWGKSLKLYNKHISHFNIDIDHQYKDIWIELQKSKVGRKKPSDLKVIYLCGPEPLNDLKVLLDNGIRRENIWAIESGRKEYQRAVEELKEMYPFVKIFKGKVEVFFEIYPESYDIIYIDACASLPNDENNTHKMIYSIFNKQKLTDLSVLITNFSHPDISNNSLINEYTDILSAFYYANKIPMKDEEGVEFSRDTLQSEDYVTIAEIRKMIEKDFSFYYQSFITRFIYELANFYSPYSKAMSNLSSCGMFFKMSDKLNNNFIKEISSLIGNELNMPTSMKFHESGEYPQQYFLYFLENLNIKWLENFFIERSNKVCSIADSVRLVNYITKIIYNIESNESFKTVITLFRDEIRSAISPKNFFDNALSYSCDIPQPHLISQLLVNQVGYPYHLNTARLERYSYTAKAKEMFTDLFVFDKCRYLYDWIPTVDLFTEGFKKFEIQLISRIIINRFNKILNRAFSPIFEFGNLFGFYEEKNFGYSTKDIPKRNVVVSENVVMDKDVVDISKDILNEIKQKLLVFTLKEEAHILFNNSLPCGTAYLEIEDVTNKLFKQMIKIQNESNFKDIIRISDGNIYVILRSSQSLELSKRQCGIVNNVLKKNGIAATIISYLD